MRTPRRLTPVAVLSCLASLAACAANSEGVYRGVELTTESPLVRYFLSAADGMETDRTLERAALEQLEDVVEEAASAVAGEPIDYPTPELGDFDFVVEIDRRGTDEFDEWFYSALYDCDVGFGAKYLFDHAGIEKGYDALEHEAVPELCALIDEYVLGEVELAEIEPRVRELEARVRDDFGITEDQWFANERIFDSAVDGLGAFTEAEVGYPLFRHCRVEIPRSMFSGAISFGELLHTYAHELLHCRIGDLQSESEEHRTLEETSCEVFGAKVVAELIDRGRIADDVLALIVEDCFDDQPESGEFVAGFDPSEDPGSEVEREFTRLAALYRNRDLDFEVWKKTQERYGYTSIESATGDDAYAQIEVLMDRMPLGEFVDLLREMRSLDELSRVASAARRLDGGLSIVAARGALTALPVSAELPAAAR